MRLLSTDIGGITQDILLFDTSKTVENCVKLIVPSPTATIARKIEAATKSNLALLFTGTNMGGGPSRRALEKHLKAGLKAYATPEAACTFADDLERVAGWGMTLVSPEEAQRLRKVERIEMRDLDLTTINRALEAFNVEPGFDALAVAVQDHGAAPPGVSDRVFRFQHLRHAVEQRNDLITFAYLAEEIPHHLTRMMAVARSTDIDSPLLLLDTGPAAAIGALEDREVARDNNLIIINVGNLHTIVFHFHQDSILGLFEHHTHLLTCEKLDVLIGKLTRGTLSNEDVLAEGGHGCFILGSSQTQPFLAVTGPRRSLMRNSTLKPYFATPHGDMMLTGCFGLVRAFAQRVEMWRDEIERALSD